MTSLLIVIFAAFLFFKSWSDGRLTVFTMVLLYWFFQMLGLYERWNDGGEFLPLLIFGSAFFCLILGKFLADVGKKNRSFSTRYTLKSQSGGFEIVTTVLIIVIIYHFAVGGIALFNVDIDRARFNTGSSGLFGLPFRIVYYVLPLYLFFLYSVMHRDESQRNIRLYFYLIAATLTLSRIFLGFKSSVIELFIFYIIAVDATLNSKSFLLKVRSLLNYSVMSGVGLVVILGVGGLYSTTQVDFDFMVERVTRLSSSSFYFLVSSFEDSGELGLASLVNDVKYFGKSLGFINDPDLFNTSKYIAADYFGVSRRSDFIAPITLGGVGQMYILGGIPAVITLSVLLGFTLSKVRSDCREYSDPMWRSLQMYFQWILFLFLTKGNLVYLGINAIVSALLFVVLMVFFYSHRMVRVVP